MSHYRDHVRGDQECDCDQHWIEEEFPARNIMFPYAPAQVCRHWRGVLALQPTFWTRVIASRAASMHTPPARFKEYLEYSGELTIDVYIGNIGYERLYPFERALIEEYTRVLAPHLHRCRVIDYSVRYATSLPLLWRDLDTIPQVLYSLQLRSEETHDPMVAGPWLKLENANGYNIPWADIRSRADAMTRKGGSSYYGKMVLDGWNLLIACDTCQDLLACNDLVVKNYRRSLNIYHENDEDAGMPLDEVLWILWKLHPEVDNITFVNVGLSEGPPDESHALSEEVSLSDLVFDNVEFTMIEGYSKLYPMVQPERFVIQACAFPATYGPLRFDRVELINIQNATDLSYFLHRWVGGALTIRACPALTDTVLRELGMHLTPEHLHPSEVDSLVIFDCANVTYAGVRELVLLRATLRQPIPVIRVHGAMWAISDAQCAAIQQRGDIEEFTWEARMPWRFEPADPVIAVRPQLSANEGGSAEVGGAAGAHSYTHMLPADEYLAPVEQTINEVPHTANTSGTDLVPHILSAARAPTVRPISDGVLGAGPAVLDMRMVKPWRMHEVYGSLWNGGDLIANQGRRGSNPTGDEEMAVDDWEEPCTTNELWSQWITDVPAEEPADSF